MTDAREIAREMAAAIRALTRIQRAGEPCQPKGCDYDAPRHDGGTTP